MLSLIPPRAGRVLWCSSLLACGSALPACQSYQPSPLDLDQHRTDLLARLADDLTLRDFVDQLDGDRVTVAELDLADGVGPAEAEVVALFYNPDLRLARMRAGVALATAETAGLWQDPVFGFDGAELLSPSGPFEFGLTLSLTLPVSGRLDVERSRDEAAYDSERLRVAAAEWEVRVAVRRAWASWRAATERVRLIEATLEEVALIGEAAERLARAGEMSRAEARLFRAEHVSLRAEQAAAVEATEQARLGLLEQMGLSPESGVTLAEDEPLPIGAVTHDPDRVAETSPAVAVLLAAYAVAEQSLRLEVRRQYPDLEIGGGVGSEDDDERLLLGLSLPIPAFNGNRRGIAEARAARELARVAVEVELERLRFRLAEASRRERSVRARRELLASELDPILDEQAAELDRLAELGEIDTLLMLETVTRRLSAKQQLLDLRLAEQLAAIDIAGLTGPNASTPSPGTTPADRPAP